MGTPQDQDIHEDFVLVHGARLHYLRIGKGRPLLLIHGLVGSAQNWKQNITTLARHASIYAIDLPNMGESERVAGIGANLEATADFLAAFMDELGLDQADVAGHSHGGAVAMMLAARHPHRVGRLILFAPANPFCNLGHQLINFYLTRRGTWLARQIPWIPRFVKLIALRRMYGDSRRLRPETLAGYIDGLEVPGTIEHLLRVLRGWQPGMARLRDALHRISDKPVLLVWGDRDHTVGLESARLLGKSLRRSQLFVISGAGHIPFEELPEECNRVMASWLGQAQTA